MAPASSTPAAAAEKQPLRDEEKGEARSWPAIQPTLPRKAQYFCLYILGVVLLACVSYMLGFMVLPAVSGLVVGLYVACGLPGFCCACYLSSWRCAPWNWVTDAYIKLSFLAYQAVLVSHAVPTTGPEYMPVSKISPKRILDKCDISYALNIKVPEKYEEEFTDKPVFAGRFVRFLEANLSKLPMHDSFEAFEPGEDPVEYVMRQLGTVYPRIYQDWSEKHDDRALTRFCLYGLGTHRLDTEKVGGERFYVVRTNVLSGLPVREGFARYGGDAYFDMKWNPVKIVDAGMGPARSDGVEELVTTRPDGAGWEHAKFRFRSSLSVLVTLVDHLFGIHLQIANIVTTAVREKLSADHPMRRFLTPFTFQTISVNDSARNNLVRPHAMAPRCFAFTDQGLQLAFAAAPSLLMSGQQVSAADGGPILNRAAYVDYLRKAKGIDTEYLRQSKTLWLIFKKFLEDYLACYYPTHAEVVNDPELQAMMQQSGHQLAFMTPSELTAQSHKSQRPTDAEKVYSRIVDFLTNFMYLVTAGHEQVGSVEAYIQDVSFCAFKWVPGANIGLKQTATAQALLMSFTSTPMPKLLGADWTHLFTELGKPPKGGRTPKAIFRTFQTDLVDFSQKCDEYNNAAPTRPFPDNYPLYVLNPKELETSISV